MNPTARPVDPERTVRILCISEPAPVESQDDCCWNCEKPSLSASVVSQCLSQLNLGLLWYTVCLTVALIHSSDSRGPQSAYLVRSLRPKVTFVLIVPKVQKPLAEGQPTLLDIPQ